MKRTHDRLPIERFSMIKFSTSVLAGALLMAVSSTHAAIVADFELNGTLANSAGTAVTLTNNAVAGSLGATGITFGIDQGPTVSGLTVTPDYTIDAEFTLDSLNGPRGNGYVKLIDFSNLQSDSGYYSYNGQFSAYPFGPSGTQNFVAGTSVRLTFSRDAAGTIAAYIDGNLIYSVSDPDNRSATELNSVLNFFIDDVATGQGEASSGFVDYIRIYDTAITPGQAVAVPEPANLALLLAGLGLIGVARRRSRA
jgi:hypothetical protein